MRKRRMMAALLSSAVITLTACNSKPQEAGTTEVEGTTIEMPKVDVNRDLSQFELKEEDTIREMEAKIEKKYDIDVVYGNDIRTRFDEEEDDLRATVYTDEAGIKTALQTLDNALKVLPRGLIAQIADPKRGILKIYLLGAVGQGENEPESGAYPAFTDFEDRELFLAIDIFLDGFINPPDILHEMTHVIDFKMQALGHLREEDWNKFNPEGFTYYIDYEKYYKNEIPKDYSYTEFHYVPRLLEQDPNDVYFLYNYAEINAWEDRATLLEPLMIYKALGNNTIAPDFYTFPHIRAKIDYLLKEVTNTFELNAEDVASWKQSLEKMSSK